MVCTFELIHFALIHLIPSLVVGKIKSSSTESEAKRFRPNCMYFLASRLSNFLVQQTNLKTSWGHWIVYTQKWLHTQESGWNVCIYHSKKDATTTNPVWTYHCLLTPANFPPIVDRIRAGWQYWRLSSKLSTRCCRIHSGDWNQSD